MSRTTVSFILNDSPKAKLISNSTREKVLKSAKELGYRPNLLARSVATGKTKVIGLISGSPKPTFMGKIFAGLISGMNFDVGVYLPCEQLNIPVPLLLRIAACDKKS